MRGVKRTILITVKLPIREDRMEAWQDFSEHTKQVHFDRFVSEMPDLVSARPQFIYVDAEEVSGFVEMGEVAPRE